MKQRYEWLDLWRSLAVLTMLVFHALWDLEHFGVIPSGTMESPAAMVVRYLGGGSFILISGTLVLRGRDPIRRGFFVFCIGLAVAVITTLAGLPVRFGILQLLGICMMLCGALRKRLSDVRSVALILICALAFATIWLLTERVMVSWKYLYPLGFRSADFHSADYWPLLPWALLYLLGVMLGNRFLREKPRARRCPAALTALGRHSLVIYLAHQPILYGLSWLLFSGKN